MSGTRDAGNGCASAGRLDVTEVTGGADAGRWSGSLNIHFVEVIGESPSSTTLDGGLCIDLAHEVISVEWP